ncbi:FAD-binding oxidoreductase [Actinospica robiniae]|uniref:FAD-binding oxidoreductase n=1 Tax=Actinospica robiniae TaxID=304901 RepID=UPI0003F8EB0E|nr:FAD-binding protein [Actinospica robiniae]
MVDIADGIAPRLAGSDADTRTALEALTVRPGDERYAELTVGHNARFTANPDEIRLVRSTAQVVEAVQEAVRAGKRLSVVSGGHCFADFVFNSEVRTIIDVSGLDQIEYDPARRAFSVGSGARMLNMYETLFRNWGVALPAGLCYSVGIGGHALGGGYGFLSRQHGVVADYIEAVEVVVVDPDGTARAVVAGRDPQDPNHDLWWAHTGAGGGNFGVVTRFWFRAPGATGHEPGEQLINPPKNVLLNACAIPWAQLDREQFGRLVSNYQRWHEQHRSPQDPKTALCGFLLLNHVSAGVINLITQVDAAVDGARELYAQYMAAMLEGVRADTVPADNPSFEYPPLPELFTARELPWLRAVKILATSQPPLNNPTQRNCLKSAYLKSGYTAEQIGIIHRYLTSPELENPTAVFAMVGFGGGQIAAPAPDATANAHREHIFLNLFQVLWPGKDGDAANLAWTRGLYGELFAETGGYPVPGEQYDGCYVNTPDMDIVDPEYNRSGVPWHTFYFKDNYPRLQRVKARWDPLNVFRHSQSVTAP